MASLLIALLPSRGMVLPSRMFALPCRMTVRMCSDDGPLVRLDKLLAERGAGSRKDVDRLIRKGMVELEGEIVGKTGGKLKVPFSSCPVVEGFEYPAPPLLAAYHKPLGVVSSMKDDRGRPDLAAVLPQTWQSSLHPVGRLDADTTGLLLFSRDGDLTHRLLHPKYVVEREYEAEVENAIDAADLGARLAAGIETTEDGESLIVPATLLEVRGQTVRLVVTEGKYRMVRRILANAGHPVTALHRVRYGEVRLEGLEIEEGEAIAIDGDALAWATSLHSLRAKELPPRAATASPTGKSGPVPSKAPSGPTRDPVVAMEAAWMPRASDVSLVMQEASVSKSEAVEALKKHRGDIVAVLLEL